MTSFEQTWLDWLATQDAGGAGAGIGDDMAILRGPRDPVLVSSDMLVDGVHFRVAEHRPGDIGRKAMACCLSDCAAMAVDPIALTLSMAVPIEWGMDQCQELFLGATEAGRPFGARIVGGDTVRWRQPLAVDVSVVAVPFAGVQPVLRGGAKLGDRLYVTGPLGGSILGHHMKFTPRVNEARRLGESLGERLHAMIDISDGLALDLSRVCEASGVGAVLDENLLGAVASASAHELAARDGTSVLDHVLGDGEDFELLLATPVQPSEFDVPVFEVGHVVERGLHLLRSDKTMQELSPRGFLH